ncbi:serine hydrolase, partial [Microbacterium sp.]|uniref:serine hydrolase n=1 Tax=Microbacterium sp. TaxID=51671 RepID=UPI003A87BB74
VVYVAGGAGLLGGPLATTAAAARDAGVLLVRPGEPSAASGTVAALREVGAASVVLVGGRGSLSTSYARSLEAAGFAVSRISGADRYGITENIARTFPSSTTRGVFTAADATITVPTAAWLSAATGQPLYFAIPQCIPDSTAAVLAARSDRPLVLTAVSALSDDVAAGRSCTTVRTRNEARLRTALQETLARYPGSSYTVSAREVGGIREMVSIGGSTRREPASMIKVFAAWAAMKRVESGRVSMNWRMPSGTTLYDCLKVMIYISDNYCHTDIVHWIGIPTLNREIRSLGLNNTYYGSVPSGTSVLYGGNRTTANDLSAMLYKLKARTILSDRYSTLLLRFMRNQPFTSRIPEGIPPGIIQASKPGSLWVASGLIQNDSAVVIGSKKTFVLTVLGSGGSSKAGIRAIARTVYSHFNGSFGAAASHPDLHVRTKARTAMLNSPEGSVIGYIPGGTALEVVDSKRRMYQVRYNGRLVWIFHLRVTGL